MKFESYLPGVIEEIADNTSIDTSSPQETLDLLPEELSEGYSVDINEGNCCDIKDEEVTPA